MKRPPKVLQVGTYPITRAVHGGQRRVRALRDAYRAQGIPCRYMAIHSPAWHGEKTVARHDLAVGKVVEDALARRPCLEDVLLGQALILDPVCREQFLRAWAQWRPDVLELEQPYLWPSIRWLLQEGAISRPRLVYSSQNFESAMKAELYAQQLPAGVREAAVRQVCDLEADLTRAADLVVAVTETDAAEFARLGCRACVVVRNGGEVKRPVSVRVAEWRANLVTAGKQRFAFFVSSGHLPNLHGFLEVLGSRLGYLPPDSELLVAGSICGLVREALLTGTFAGVNASRLRLLGILPDGDLAAVLALSSAVLLPITTGGGSNLKTVEALFAQRPIVATRFAFRSYEEFVSCARVRLTDNPEEFRRALSELLLQPATAPPPQPALPAELLQLTWPQLCAPLAERVLQLVERTARCA